MGNRPWRWPWSPPRELHDREPSTLPEAQRALQRSRAEQVRAITLRPRVDQVVKDLARERETNHMAERFRGALRGGAT